MLFKCNYSAVLIPLSLSLALLVAGCNNSKIAQCERLINVVNQGSGLIERNKGQQVVTSLRLSQDLADIAQQIASLYITDPQLNKYQTSFFKTFEAFSQSIAKAAHALGSAKTAKGTLAGKIQLEKARQEIDKAMVDAAKAAKQSDALASQVNKYCSQQE